VRVFSALMSRRRKQLHGRAKACGPGTPGLVLSLQVGDVGPSARRAGSLQVMVTNKVMDTGESAL